jgi:hypothetical protein
MRGYGEIFAKLFTNLNQCPLEDPVDQCHGFPKDGYIKASWEEVRRTIKEDPSKFLSLLQLNATFVDEVFAFAGASFTLEDLKQSSCAAHVRFGDFFIRDSTNYTEQAKAKLEGQRRACKDPKNVSACFERVAEMI